LKTDNKWKIDNALLYFLSGAFSRTLERILLFTKQHIPVQASLVAVTHVVAELYPNTA